MSILHFKFNVYLKKRQNLILQDNYNVGVHLDCDCLFGNRNLEVK